MANIRFTEKQRFRQLWLWLLMFGATVLVCYSIYHKIKVESQTETAELLIPLYILAAAYLLLYTFRLETRIDKKGIEVRLFPVHIKFRKFSWEEIEEAYVREYSPITEYGGWGWRYSLSGSGKAYNVSGNQGIQLVLKNGKKLLIGTKKPDAAIAALLHFRPVETT